MKIWELTTGIYVNLTEEENMLVNKLLKDEKSYMNERERFIAQHLVNKDVFIKQETDGDQEDRFAVNYGMDIWRD